MEHDDRYLEGNPREDFYAAYGVRHKMNKQKIYSYLKKLEKNGDDYKIKHIKKFYRIYNMCYQILSLIYSRDTFEYTDESFSTDDFYSFLIYVNSSIKDDIIKFIDMIQDDDFNNKEILLYDLYKNQEKFRIYLNFKHFYTNEV